MENILTLSALAVAMIPVTVACVATIRATIEIADRFVPITSIAVGIALVALTGETVWQAMIIQGLLVGLSASGLYSNGKAGKAILLKK